MTAVDKDICRQWRINYCWKMQNICNWFTF